jgi:glutathione S-transferase
MMALEHKGLEFERNAVGFTQIRTIGDGTFKTVPVIADNSTMMADSFMIATYLEQAYSDRPTLFGGEGGRTMARLIEAWSAKTIHPYIGQAIMMDIFEMLGPEDQAYFRQSREARFGKMLEDVPKGRGEKHNAFLENIEPLRLMLQLQPFIGGDGPLFADYIVFGAFQWARICSPFEILPKGDTVRDWFERCLDLHDGLGRSVPAAA